MIKIYSNSKYFELIVQALNYLFTRYNKSISEDKHILWSITNKINLSSNDIYILFNPHNINPMPKKYIIYNFEQLQVITTWDISNFESDYWTKLKNAWQVWDYSLTNIEYLKNTHNIDAMFLPLGWSPTMKNINFKSTLWSERINTIMFIGLMNEKRRDFLKPIHTLCKSMNYNMFLSNKCWDFEYINICSITKIAINIHYYSGSTILEVHRIIPLILSDIWIISERSNDRWYDDLFNDIIDWIDINTCCSKIEEIILLDPETVNIELKNRKRKLIERCDYLKFWIDSNIKI